MDRRNFLRNVVVGVAAAAGSKAVAQVERKKRQLEVKDPSRLKARPLSKDALKINFKGQTFQVTESQRRAFDALPRDLQQRLNKPQAGRVMSEREFQELRQLNELAKKHLEHAASTVMCPW